MATTNVAAVRYEAFAVNLKEWLQYRAFKAISDLREAWANKEPLANQIMAITAVRALLVLPYPSGLAWAHKHHFHTNTLARRKTSAHFPRSIWKQCSSELAAVPTSWLW